MAVAILLAAGAAFLSALAVVFQRIALESAPTANSLSPRLALIVAGRVGPRWWRATALGSAAAILFAGNAAFTKTATTLLRDGGVAGRSPLVAGIGGQVSDEYLGARAEPAPVPAPVTPGPPDRR